MHVLTPSLRPVVLCCVVLRCVVVMMHTCYSHELFFNLALPLINCCGHLKDYRQKLVHCRLVVENADRCWPQYFSPKSNFYQGIADTYFQILSTRTQSRNAIPKSTLLSYRQNRIDVLAKQYQIFRCVPDAFC